MTPVVTILNELISANDYICFKYDKVFLVFVLPNDILALLLTYSKITVSYFLHLSHIAL